MVSTTPWISSDGLSVARIWSIDSLSCEMPSSAKNSHCTGTSTALAAESALSVRRLSEGRAVDQQVVEALIVGEPALARGKRRHGVAQPERPIGIRHLGFDADKVVVGRNDIEPPARPSAARTREDQRRR